MGIPRSSAITERAQGPHAFTLGVRDDTEMAIKNSVANIIIFFFT